MLRITFCHEGPPCLSSAVDGCTDSDDPQLDGVVMSSRIVANGNDDIEIHEHVAAAVGSDHGGQVDGPGPVSGCAVATPRPLGGPPRDHARPLEDPPRGSGGPGLGAIGQLVPEGVHSGSTGEGP